jgi:hypothetical protein
MHANGAGVKAGPAGSAPEQVYSGTMISDSQSNPDDSSTYGGQCEHQSGTGASRTRSSDG